jgi:aspartyl protease
MWRFTRMIGGMGEVKVEVVLENAVDRGLQLRGMLEPEMVRAINASVLVDSRAMTLVLPQEQVEALGLENIRKVIVRYADERKEERPVASAVTIRVGDRAATLDCVVGPPNSEPLLGQVPLEVMDLLVDCVEQRLVPRPESPFLPLIKLKGTS